MIKKRILFAGYAPVHFVCFEPVYRLLWEDPRLDVWLSGGFKAAHHGEVTFSLEGFYDRFDVDPERVIPFERAREQDFDVLVCGHLSDSLFPRSVGRSVQIFHGVSFKNRCVREQALRYDMLCLPGGYHAEMYRKRQLIRTDGSRCLVTGFPKADTLINEPIDRDAFLQTLGMDPSRKTLLYAPTGDKNNSLETVGEKAVSAIREAGQWNLLIKLHDHPKNTTLDWVARLAHLQDNTVRLVHGWNIVPYLQVADLLLTDASSAAVEYTLLDRPIVFLQVPKLLKKMARKGGALDLETYGQKIGVCVGKKDDVVHAVEESLATPAQYSDIRRRMANHVFYKPGSASTRVAAVIRHAAGLTPSLPEDVQELSPEAPAGEPAKMRSEYADL